jgi:hypothetical protein
LGNHAAKNTLRYVSMWCLFTLLVTLSTFHEHFTAVYLFYTWDFMQLFFYLTLWLAPLNRLYRRPAGELLVRVPLPACLSVIVLRCWGSGGVGISDITPCCC